MLPALRPGEIALMYSGGLDSTATALLLAERHERVHLLTYANGYGHWHLARTARRVAELRRVAGDRFVHVQVSSKAAFERLLVAQLPGAFSEFGSGFVWCMGCKLAMHALSAAYCLRHGVPAMSDGSSEATGEMVEQMLISLSLVREFYGSLAIAFTTPVYDDSRAASRARLTRAGMGLGLQVLDRHLAVQPTCMAGELYYLPYLLFNKRVRHDEATVARFIASRSDMARRVVADALAHDGLVLDAVLAARKLASV